MWPRESDSVQEKRIEAKFVRAVKFLRGCTYKLAGRGGTGKPDRVVLLPWGRTRLVELKAPRGRLSPRQRYEHGELARRGFRVAVLDSVESVEQWRDEMQDDRHFPLPNMLRLGERLRAEFDGKTADRVITIIREHAIDEAEAARIYEDRRAGR